MVSPAQRHAIRLAFRKSDTDCLRILSRAGSGPYRDNGKLLYRPSASAPRSSIGVGLSSPFCLRTAHDLSQCFRVFRSEDRRAHAPDPRMWLGSWSRSTGGGTSAPEVLNHPARYGRLRLTCRRNALAQFVLYASDGLPICGQHSRVELIPFFFGIRSRVDAEYLSRN